MYTSLKALILKCANWKMFGEKRMLFLCVLAMVKIVGGLDIGQYNTVLAIEEEQQSQTWIVEDSTTTHPVNFTLLARDGDIDTYKKFTIVQLNKTHARIGMNYTFDFEEPKDVIDGAGFKVESSNGDELFVTIQIENLNDNSPKFTNLPATINVSEATGVGSTLFTVEGVDNDGASGGNNFFNVISFSIVDGNIGNKFSLNVAGNQESAILKLDSRLDYDKGPEMYNITINATDYRSFVNEATARWTVSYLIINVTDVDDLGAIFTQNLYEVTLPEDLAPGSFVIKVTAFDKDKTNKGDVQYGLVEETNPSGIFAINETTGNITLVGSLDRKSQSIYALLVSANSTYHDPMHAQVFIRIEDANVHAPNFTSNEYHATVPENAEVNTLVLVVQASDFDEIDPNAQDKQDFISEIKGDNAAVRYSLEGEEATSFFVTTIRSIGYIYVNASLDYDLKKTYNFTVRATEIYTAEKFNDSSTVIMEVTEVLANENNPKFNQSSYSVNVTENSVPGRIVLVGATDSDQDHYGSVTYSIVDGSQGMFVIDNITGWINTTSQLDRERKDSYILTVRASDGDTFARHTDVLVVVTVLDSNDHSPTFLANRYAGSVVENSNIGNIVVAVEARDVDEGSNAMFGFSVERGDGKFSVDTSGNLGYITVNGSLDFEMDKNFTFMVIAKETSTAEQRQNNVSITINLIDVNDNAPVFSPVSGYVVDIAENSINGTSVLNVSASDADSGAYGQITFSLTTSSVPFIVDPKTGELLVDGNLDRETTDSYDLTIQASDGGRPSLSSYVHVIVNITDENDHHPVFSESSYVVNIDENTNVGSNILTVTATDHDQESNSQLIYYIEGSGGFFKVDSNGVVSVNGSLDYESNTSFSFTVFAQESLTSEKWTANCTVTVNLSDVNEYDPEFTQTSYYALIEENKAAGFEVITVSADDKDGYFNSISYTILSGNDEGLFTLNHTSGVVKTTGGIDRETTEDNFVLKIQASDNGNPNRTTETFLVIEIFDANDHSPIFTKAWYNTTIPESLPVGTIVLTVKATDLDTNATNSDVRYFVPDSNGKFDVNPSTGQLFVNASLDFETKSTYTFMIFAEESQTAMKRQHNASISITLTDTNEFDPVFTSSIYRGNITENSPTGTSVVQISTSDKDGYYDRITYSILPGDDSASFSINSTTGLITSATQLDRESQEKYILAVQATDNGNPGRTAEVTVVVNILDSNDQQPEFSKPSYNSTIPENVPIGTTVLTVGAEDKDIGDNALFNYHIVGGDDKFEISSDGVIVTKAMLDYESKTSYTFLVIANETNSSIEPNATVVVVIQDVNEFNPVFDQVHYTTNVTENSPVGMSLIKVSATDSDGHFKQVSYSIVSGNDGKFTINSTTGEIKTNSTLDRETSSQFILTVRAQDNGMDPARTAEAVVVITIIDVSDHGPKFHQSSYKATVFENAAVDTTILTVTATDYDLGSNAIIEYSVVGGDGTFRIDGSGNVILNKSLDYETRTRYEFQIMTTEPQTSTGFNDTTNVTIIIQDVNEFNPKFSELSYTAVVNKSRSPGTRAVKVSATDDDGSDDTISYSIIHGNAGDAFKINATTGWIEVAKMLGGGSVDQYVLTVRAEDSGDFPRTAEVLVTITINETTRNASFLLQDIYNVTILENALVDSVVVKLDLSYSNNGIVSAFSFSTVGGDGDFDVNQQGEITVANALDYESKTSYTFTIVVTEIQPPSGLIANATINVQVKDVNEFNPKFNQTIYRANVSENAAPKTYVTQVFANDNDSHYNAITYSIFSGNHDSNFTINSTTGVITTATPLDRETQTQFHLTVRASDNGPSARTSEVLVIVDILDISEHPPMFLMPNYTATVYENSAVGTIVLVVGTNDHDTMSSSVSYSLVGANGKFGVTNEGRIYVNGSLDYETDDMLSFTVIAEEEVPYSHLRNNVTVTVNLKDVNEFNPQFNQTIYSASVKENVGAGTFVLTVFASDKDKDINVLSYSFVSGNEQGNFSINQTNGEIKLAKPLDRESTHQIILTVRAEDNGKPARTAEVPVVIGVIDSNDQGPRFSMPQYDASVSEDATIGTNVVAIQAVDLDATADMLEYAVVGEGAFRVETHFGLGFIVVNQELDYEQIQSYRFMVYAIEKTPEKRNTSCWVNITILDANDNRPVFVKSSYSGSVVEGVSAGTTVVNVSAVDKDTKEFGPLYYNIIDGNSLGYFDINNSTGRIYTSGILDRENQTTYFLVVEVRDNGSPALTETVTVTITVLDSNDVTPQFIATPYFASVPENSVVNTTILTVQAVDLDKGRNGEIMYDVVGGDGLFIVKQDGDVALIILVGKLDYEQNKTITFSVVAKETQTSEKREANTTVVISVTDVNDNAPMFTQSVYEFSVAESPSFPVFVGTVMATDEDSGLFAKITYSIIHGDENGNFTINNKTGKVETGAILNRELRNKYVLTIQALDGGSPPRKAITTITVSVTDKNEKPPYFEDTPYQAEIVENKEYSDAVVLKVKAIDPDLMDITYTLEGFSGFSIGSTSGIISVTGSFDREMQSVYNLTVTARDQGGLNVSEEVIITVQDTNDNSPQFLNTPYETRIPDNTSQGIVILTVQATDIDEAHNGDIIYSLLGAEGKFIINKTTGAVSVSGKLDSQEKSLYKLEVIATDRGIPQAMINSTTITVNLTDYSNHAPEFANVAWVGTILEEEGPTFVVNIEASDSDSGILGEITFDITDGNTYNAFRVNATGAIISRFPLDYENDTQKTFDLTVMVTDRLGLTDKTQVRITVLDANDNVPMIINVPSPKEFNISDNVPAGTLLYVLQGTDLDSGNNGAFEFFGSSVPDNLTIDQTTGLIKTKTKLQSSGSSSISFTAYVKDKGSPSRSSPNITLRFNIISDPNSIPFLLPTLTKANVSENASIDYVVVKINSSDSPDNFTILFELPSDSNFKIDNQGSISLAKKLDRETLGGYSLLVQASKAGKQAIGYVSITVTDVNDESPEFQFKVYKGQIDENLPEGSRVLEVKATDGDDQDLISYEITSGNTNDVFNISSSGEIKIAKPPDHETTSFFNLTVVASDGVNTGTTFVELTIVDINDNTPKFLNSSYSLSLPEHTPGGTSVVQVSTKDADGDIVIYSISGDNGRFTIDSITGVIYTTDKLLDFETTTSYTLNVTAKDPGGLKSSVLVTVNITDSNDNSPVFSVSSYNVTIPENFTGLLTSLNINATDQDSGNNGQVIFSIVDGLPQFTIDSTTGVLNLTVPVDRDDSGLTIDEHCRGVVVLSVKASDNGIPALSDTTTVLILLKDINDNVPSFSQASYKTVISVLDTGNVLRVMASDPDCDVNSDIYYSFTSVNGSSLFEMNSTTGNITIIKPLNGSQGVYILNVTASNELATPKLQSSALVTITVIENKNYPPMFAKDQYSFNVSENAEIGLTIGRVTASDINQDKEGAFIYAIENPNHTNPFVIDSLTGVITLVRKLDREVRKNYTLVVVAQDFGEPALRHTTNVFISVNDVNDVIPKFEQDEQRYSVAENITLGSLVCTVLAVDEDADEFGEPVYVIYSGNEAGHFRIDNSTGMIYLVKSLDREVVNIFELTIYAYNHGSNTARRRRRDIGDNFDVLKVIIEVTDINDNYPEFDPINYVAGFKLSDEPGTNVTTIKATDKDEGENSKIIYSFKSGNNASAFAIDPNTGVITTTDQISQLNDVETKLTLTIAARDLSTQGLPKVAQQSATVTLYKLPETDPLNLLVRSGLDEKTLRELLQNITGPTYDIIIQSITPDGLLSNVKYYIVKNNVFLTQEEMTNLIIAYCQANEQICKNLGIDYLSKEGSNDTLLGEDDITILEAMLITLGVIVGIGGLLGILLLCCLRRRRKRYMPVYESSNYMMPMKAVSFDERPQYYQDGNDPNRESQEVELHMDEEQTSVDSAEEMRAGSTSSGEIEKEEAIAKVQAYMNQALMNDDDSDTDSSEDEEQREPDRPRVDGDSSTGSGEPLVSSYTITNL